MPAPGDQHNGGIANPFEEPRQRVSEYTAEQVATLQSRLEKKLGPEYISSRAGPSGAKVHYITAEKCIELANEVFGFNGWSSSVRDTTIDFVDEHPQTLKISLGLSVIVRVTLKDGTYHEDVGYGHIENCKGKAAAFEKAKKEGTTDALKRALRSFGNVLGNCIYDKTYMAKVTKMKVAPKKFDEAALYRHGDFARRNGMMREESRLPVLPAGGEDVIMEDSGAELGLGEFSDDLLEGFDEADFCVAEEPDGFVDESTVSATTAVQSASSGENKASAVTTKAGQPNFQPPPPPQRQHQGGQAGGAARPPQTPNAGGQRLPQGHPNRQSMNPQRPAASPATPAAFSGPAANATAQASVAEPVAFFSARAVNQLPDATLQSSTNGSLPIPQAQQVFNPKAESPSIRKTPGIDHSSSKPVGRNGQHVPPTASQQGGSSVIGSGAATTVGNMAAPAGPGRPQGAVAPSAPRGGNVVNPQFDHSRRIGAPGVAGSPLANRGQYRPPTMKRPLHTDSVGQGAGSGAGPPPGHVGSMRPALAEVPVNGPGAALAATMGAGQDTKRQKTA